MIEYQTLNEKSALVINFFYKQRIKGFKSQNGYHCNNLATVNFNMRLKLLLIFLFVYSGIYSQIQINKSLFEHARNTPEPFTSSAEKLVDYLSKGLKGEKEKAEVIAYWIATHIDYDLPAFLNKSYQSESWELVLSSHKAICGGYANLFNHLCSVAGIEAFTVAGYVTGNGIETVEDFKTTNHIWNVALIKGNFYLFDLTFAAGFICKNGEKYDFIKKLQPEYLFASPIQLIKTHLPAQERWQLLEHPVGMKDFLIKEEPDSSDKDTFHFTDSINDYRLLDLSDRAIKDAIDAYKVNPQPLELAWIYQKQAYDISVSDSEKSTLKTAITYYNQAISIYQSLGESEKVEKCERGISYIKQQLRKGFAQQ